MSFAGVLFNLCNDEDYDISRSDHILCHLKDRRPILSHRSSISRLVQLALSDPACAFAPLLHHHGAECRAPMAALLAASLQALLRASRILTAAAEASRSGGGGGAAGGAQRCDDGAPQHLRMTLCALLCLPKADAAKAEWEAVQPLLTHLLAGDHLRDVVRAMGSLLLAPATSSAAKGASAGCGGASGSAAAAGSDSSGGAAAGDAHQAAPAAAVLPPPGLLEWLLGPEESPETAGLKYALKAALRALAALAKPAAAAGGGAAAGGAAAAAAADEPPAKRHRPNPAGPESFEAIFLRPGREVKVRVRDEGTTHVYLKVRIDFLLSALSAQHVLLNTTSCLRQQRV